MNEVSGDMQPTVNPAVEAVNKIHTEQQTASATASRNRVQRILDGKVSLAQLATELGAATRQAGQATKEQQKIMDQNNIAPRDLRTDKTNP